MQSHCVGGSYSGSEIENGRMNICRSEEASRVENWNGSIIGSFSTCIIMAMMLGTIPVPTY